MPCRDYNDDNLAYSRLEKRYKDRCDELSRHACLFATALAYELHKLNLDVTKLSLGNLLEDAGEPVDQKYVKEAIDWWTGHRKADLAARKEVERKAALKARGKSLVAKLSTEDREALAAFGVSLPGTPAIKSPVKTKK